MLDKYVPLDKDTLSKLVGTSVKRLDGTISLVTGYRPKSGELIIDGQATSSSTLLRGFSTIDNQLLGTIGVGDTLPHEDHQYLTGGLEEFSSVRPNKPLRKWKDSNGVELRNGDVIDLGKSDAGENVMVVTNVHQLEIRYGCNLGSVYQQNPEGMLGIDPMSRAPRWLIVGNIYDYVNKLR